MKHHRRLLKRLRAEWAVFYDRPSLMRRRGAWHVIFAGGHSYTCDTRRCTALQLALMVNRDDGAKAGVR